MLARAIVAETEDGDVSVDYVRAEVAQASKRNWRVRFTPSQEMEFRDGLWMQLADRGMTPHEIAIACLRAARSARHIRRRLRKLEEQDRRAQAQAG